VRRIAFKALVMGVMACLPIVVGAGSSLCSRGGFVAGAQRFDAEALTDNADPIQRIAYCCTG